MHLAQIHIRTQSLPELPLADVTLLTFEQVRATSGASSCASTLDSRDRHFTEFHRREALIHIQHLHGLSKLFTFEKPLCDSTFET